MGGFPPPFLSCKISFTFPPHLYFRATFPFIVSITLLLLTLSPPLFLNMSHSLWHIVGQCCNVFELISLRRVSKPIGEVSRGKLTWKYAYILTTDERTPTYKTDNERPICQNRFAPYPVFCILDLPRILSLCPRLQKLGFRMLEPAKRSLCLKIPQSVWGELRSTLATHNGSLTMLSWLQYRTVHHRHLAGILEACPQLERLQLVCSRYFKLTIEDARLLSLPKLRLLIVCWNGSDSRTRSSEWSVLSIEAVLRVLERTPNLETLEVAKIGNTATDLTVKGLERDATSDVKYTETIAALVQAIIAQIRIHLESVYISGLDRIQEIRDTLVPLASRVHIVVDHRRLDP